MEAPFTKKTPDIGQQQKRVIAKDAYYAGCWVYCIDSGKWYTPEEFVHSPERIYEHRGKPQDSQFKVMDPKAGISAKMEKVRIAQAELEEFTKKVCDYYDFKRKGK